jgi:ABC-type molybdenum transport system ATPase subunit/photorepair protein PhrA
VVEQFNLRELARENFLRLSYGQRRSVLLARAVVHRPQVLLLDEPLDGLDSGSGKLMRVHLRILSESGTALVVVTHRPGD